MRRIVDNVAHVARDLGSLFATVFIGHDAMVRDDHCQFRLNAWQHRGSCSVLAQIEELFDVLRGRPSRSTQLLVQW